MQNTAVCVSVRGSVGSRRQAGGWGGGSVLHSCPTQERNLSNTCYWVTIVGELGRMTIFSEVTTSPLADATG